MNYHNVRYSFWLEFEGMFLFFKFNLINICIFKDHIDLKVIFCYLYKCQLIKNDVVIHIQTNKNYIGAGCFGGNVLSTFKLNWVGKKYLSTLFYEWVLNSLTVWILYILTLTRQ